MDGIDPKELHEYIKKTIHTEIRKLGLLTGHIRIGEVVEVLPNNRLSVRVDGSTVSQVIRCNPDVTFTVGDLVWVTLINGDSKNKFIFSRTGTNILNQM